LKTKELKYFFISIVFVTIIGACSTKKDALVNRKYHSTTTKYNVLYNGNLALESGLQELALASDNFWEILPIEPMQIIEPVFGQDSVLRNPNFIRAEDKAIKAIEKHSMNVGGVERNPEMDQAYLLLGKARYYDQRFIPALESFNFILYKYPDSKNIDELKFWKEKTNVRLDNNNIAINNLNAILEKIISKNETDKNTLLNSNKKVKNNQLIADITATMAQAYLNEEQYDQAITNLRIAKNQTSKYSEKARYTFIIGQLLQKQDRKEEAVTYFNEIVKMNRRSPREFLIHSHTKITAITDEDTIAFDKKYNKLLNDRENRPYLDVINHQIALYYDKTEQDNKAIKHYNQSLKHRSNDTYRVASNYRNIAEIHFYNAKYSLAGKYYDSTLVNLDNKTREFRNIKRKRENLDEVIKYEAIAEKNDSILMLINFSEEERIAFFEKHIAKLKQEQERFKKEIEKTNWQDTGYTEPHSFAQPLNTSKTDILTAKNAAVERIDAKSTSNIGNHNSISTNSTNNFYFYNPTTIASGKNEFRKRWGNRTLKDYWRLSNYAGSSIAIVDENQETEELDQQGNPVVKEKKETDPRLTIEFYIKQIPTEKNIIDSLQKNRNFAYYQLGMIYKDKFKEYKLAQSKLENLLESNPEERLILPSMYNLYRIYETLGYSDKMLAIQSQINSKYPDSRYAQLINNPNDLIAIEGLADATYNSMFEIYKNGDYKKLLSEIEPLIDQYAGEQIIAKLELLKASAIGNLKGLNEYKKALNYLALTYPNSTEGKEAENLLNTTIPKLEKLDFGKTNSKSWKIIHKTTEQTDNTELQTKLEKFISERPEKLKITFDNYTETENFITIHNIYSEQKAKDLIIILKEYKDYKMNENFIPISSDDYKIIQIKKNFDVYLHKYNTIP